MFRPTPGRSCTTGTPILPRWTGSPTPDNCRMCGEQDFAQRIRPLDRAAAGKLDADRALAVEHDAMHERMGDELQVRPLQRRPQIGARGRGAAAAAPGLLTP